MGVTHTTKFDYTPHIKAEVEGIGKKSVEVGVFDGEHAWLAGIHEYGCRIVVTEKMRKWFIAQGHPLKPSTTVIVIPERSFIRAGFDQNVDDVNQQMDMLAGPLASGQINGDTYLDAFGTVMEGKIKEYATNLSSPPDTQFTIDRKQGKSNPLVDTGDMIGSISHRIV